jgi:hypothetical protein
VLTGISRTGKGTGFWGDNGVGIRDVYDRAGVFRATGSKRPSILKVGSPSLCNPSTMGGPTSKTSLWVRA